MRQTQIEIEGNSPCELRPIYKEGSETWELLGDKSWRTRDEPYRRRTVEDWNRIYPGSMECIPFEVDFRAFEVLGSA